MVDAGMVPAGAYRNRDHLAGRVTAGSMPEDRLWPLFDPQTSGGLLLSVSEVKRASIEVALNSHGVFFRIIGRFSSAEKTIVLSNNQALF
jgi:selenide,water dikinase